VQFRLAQAKRLIRVGSKIGGGGEGGVFTVDGLPDSVAKVYATPPDNRKIQKISRMVAGSSAALLRVSAWPTDLVTDSNGSVRGILMPLIASRRDVHELYTPKSRADSFPEADFRFLVHVGANVARAFAVVHEHGHVIGDVNQSSVMVGPDGTARLVDCDSFQILSGSEVFPCDVGQPLFTPPELQGKTLRGVVRSQNHDAFGLSVLLFHLFFMGRHPFIGRYSGAGEMPPDKAIAEFRFAYGPDRRMRGMERPPGTAALEALGPAVSALFVRAFSSSNAIVGRPTAKEWIGALDALRADLQVCAGASWHQFPRSVATCPWCAIETQTGARLFGQKIRPTGSAGVVDISSLWKAVIAIPDPGPDPSLPSDRAWQTPSDLDLGNSGLRATRRGLSVVAILLGLGAWISIPGDGGFVWMILAGIVSVAIWPRVTVEERMTSERAMSGAKAEWDSVLARWRRDASRSLFAGTLASLEKAKNELNSLTQERRRRMSLLEKERETLQRRKYLDRFRIDRARINKIGPGRTATLLSYGIETADDIERRKIDDIPGFGSGLIAELVQWRRMHEQNFRFNPSDPVDPREIAALDRELDARRQALVELLRGGPDRLRHSSQELTAARKRLLPLIEAAWDAFKRAEARKNAL
jgi:DNA-binding helix-hairpin-helix protein with protein kinase domain